MAATFTIDPRNRVVRVYAWDRVTDAGARRLFQRLRTDPRFDPTFNQLSDFRDVTEIALTHEALAALAAEPLYAPGTRRALVVASGAHYGIARMFASYATMRGQNVTVFHDLEAAERWLAVGSARPDRPESSDV